MGMPHKFAKYCLLTDNSKKTQILAVHGNQWDDPASLIAEFLVCLDPIKMQELDVFKHYEFKVPLSSIPYFVILCFFFFSPK